MFSPFRVLEGLSSMEQLLLWTTLFLAVVMLWQWIQPQAREGFSSSHEFVFKQGPEEIMDDFYVTVYDAVLFDEMRADYEVGELINLTRPTEHSVILDVGCATGKRTKRLADRGLKVLGIDVAPTMIKQAKKRFPDLHFQVQDVTADSLAFQTQVFTHILCLYYTLYYMPNKAAFFRHCMEWLMPGGYLVVHLVDRDKVDPLIPPTVPSFLVKPNNTSPYRQRKVQLENMQYSSKFEQNDGEAHIWEKFKMRDGGVRTQQQTLYMEDVSQIVNLAQETGFLLQAKADMASCSYPNQFLYVFVKPT